MRTKVLQADQASALREYAELREDDDESPEDEFDDFLVAVGGIGVLLLLLIVGIPLAMAWGAR